MKQDKKARKALLEAFSHADMACRRDGYPQVVFMGWDGQFSFSRLYTRLNLFTALEVKGIVDGRWINGTYQTEAIHASEEPGRVKTILGCYKVDAKVAE